MPPSVSPLRLRILEALQTRLRGIDGQGNYYFAFKSGSVVLEPTANILTLPPTECPGAVIEPTPEGSRFFMPAFRMRNQFQVSITAFADAPGGTSTSRRAETWEKLIADLERAITTDITLGGLVIDMRLQEPTPGFDLGASPRVVVVQPLVCNVIRAYGEP